MMPLKSAVAGAVRWIRWLTAPESLDAVPMEPGPPPGAGTFLGRLAAREPLPEDEPEAGRKGPTGFTHRLLSRESLPTDEEAPRNAPGFLHRLFSRDPLDEDRVKGSG